MKKFISMVMAAAMVVSLVPATAFAATGDATFRTDDVMELNGADAKTAKDTPSVLHQTELEIVVGDHNGSNIYANDEFEIRLDFEGLEMADDNNIERNLIDSKVMHSDYTDFTTAATITVGEFEKGQTWVDIKIAENGENIIPGDKIVITLLGALNAGGTAVCNGIVLTDATEGTVATVTVSGDFGDSAALPVVKVLAEGIKVNIPGKNKEVAEEATQSVAKFTIKSVVGTFTSADTIKVKVNKGFDLYKPGTITAKNTAGGTVSAAFDATPAINDDGILIIGLAKDGVKTIEIDGMEIDAVSAKPGDIAVITATCGGYESGSDEAIVVIADAVTMFVDAKADVPVIYSGVNVANDGLALDTDKNKHEALTVTIEESVAGAWSLTDSWTLTLPEGVYAATGSAITLNTSGTKGFDADWTDPSGVYTEAKDPARLAAAYVKGEYEEFDFGRRAITRNGNDMKVQVKVDLVLVAEPGFEGLVNLKLEGAGITDEAMEVTIAEFKAPYTVEAAQNDLIIDYKDTAVSDIVIKEAEAGLFSKVSTENTFKFAVEDISTVDSYGKATVNEESNMEVGYKSGKLEVKEESDDAAAVITISGMKLNMKRDLAAGAYDLYLDAVANSHLYYFGQQRILTTSTNATEQLLYVAVNDGDDFDYTVKEGFVNIITAGRDQDDASFTKKVVVPVGESYMIAGEETVALDVPAYINAAGYTMLPVRAVAVALGINTNNVIWHQATKTVTVLYGHRIISMQVGADKMYVDGTAIPTSAAPEVVNGRTFLPLRDLATALGVTAINYDPATKTATLN